MNRIEIIFMNQGSAILIVNIGDYHFHHCYDSMEQMYEDYKEIANFFTYDSQAEAEEALIDFSGNEIYEYRLDEYYQDTTCYAVDSADFNNIDKDYGENARIFAELVENENSNHDKRRN